MNTTYAGNELSRAPMSLHNDPSLVDWIIEEEDSSDWQLLQCVVSHEVCSLLQPKQYPLGRGDIRTQLQILCKVRQISWTGRAA